VEQAMTSESTTITHWMVHRWTVERIDSLHYTLRLEQLTVFRKDILQVFFNFDPNFVINLDVQINRDRFVGRNHFDSWGTTPYEDTAHEYSESQSTSHVSLDVHE